MSARAGGKRSETKRRWGPRTKLPGEFAEFRLEDGQFLGDVLGNEFFGPESGSIGGKPLSAPQLQRIRAGNHPLGGRAMKTPGLQSKPESVANTAITDGSDVADSWPSIINTKPTAVPSDMSRPMRPLPITFPTQKQDGSSRPVQLESGGAFVKNGNVPDENFSTLPGVGRPISLLEAFDRVDNGETPSEMGIDPAYRPDGKTPVDYFAARVEEYVGASPAKRIKLRSEVSFHKTLEELLKTQDDYQIYLDGLQQHVDPHSQPLDAYVRLGQATLGARKKDFREALGREREILIPDVGEPTNLPVDATRMFEKLGFEPEESRLSGYVSLARLAANNPINYFQAGDMEIDAVETANRLAGMGHFTLYSPEWDVFRHGYGSIRATMELRPWAAKRIGEVYELKRSDNPPDESLMDLYNNNVGRKLAIDALTRNKPLHDVVLDSAREGSFPGLGGNQSWPIEEMVLRAMREGRFQMEPFRLKQPAAMERV